MTQPSIAANGSLDAQEQPPSQRGYEKRMPKCAFQAASYSVAGWENTFENPDGTTRTSLSATIRRSFFNKAKNDFDESKLTVMNIAELGLIIHLLERLQAALVRQTATEDTPF